MNKNKKVSIFIYLGIVALFILILAIAYGGTRLYKNIFQRSNFAVFDARDLIGEEAYQKYMKNEQDKHNRHLKYDKEKEHYYYTHPDYNYRLDLFKGWSSQLWDESVHIEIDAVYPEMIDIYVFPTGDPSSAKFENAFTSNQTESEPISIGDFTAITTQGNPPNRDSRWKTYDPHTGKEITETKTPEFFQIIDDRLPDSWSRNHLIVIEYYASSPTARDRAISIIDTIQFFE